MQQDSLLPKRSGNLLSLIGLLRHAMKVVKPGRAFLQSLINAASSVSALDPHVHLTPVAKADYMLVEQLHHLWNGMSMLPPDDPEFKLVSDASSSWG